MRVLGIDPGLTRLGIGVIDGSPGTQTLVSYSVLRTPASEPIEQRLLTLGRGVDEALDEFQPSVLALERVFAQKNLHSVMGVAQVSGIVLRAAAERSIQVAMLTPTQVKSAVTGYGQAEKAQVGEMVRRLLRLTSPPKPADAADALALAIAQAREALRTGVRADTSSQQPTKAQRAWAAAEARARRSS